VARAVKPGGHVLVSTLDHRVPRNAAGLRLFVTTLSLCMQIRRALSPAG